MILAVYVVGYVACFRLAVRGMAKDLGGADDWVDVVMFTMGGLFTAILWPLGIPVVIAYKMAKGDPQHAMRVLAGESRADKARRIERERDDLREKVRRLERELRIGE